jgi:hypothetical protein
MGEIWGFDPECPISALHDESPIRPELADEYNFG